MSTFRVFWSSLLLLGLPCIYFALEDPPLILDHNYKAIGEIVDNSSEFNMQLRFEEHYDNSTNNAVFTIWEAGVNITYVENGRTGQTLRYFNGTECTLETTKEWEEIGVGVPGYEIKGGRILFSLRQFINMDKNYLVDEERAKNSAIRDIPATSWVYRFKNTKGSNDISITVKAFFSKPGWSTTSGYDKRVPLGFHVTKTITDKKSGQVSKIISSYTNVFAYLHNVLDRSAFKARENLYCMGATHPLKFPTFEQWGALSLRAEYILPDTQSIKTMDVYYDTVNRMVRVDLDRIDTPSDTADATGAARWFTSQITSKDLGATFKFDVLRKKATCTVHPLDQYPFDPQEIVNPKLDPSLWGIKSILGSNTANYTYMGKTTKRNMPCHLFQGIRKDWPEESANIKSFWEWCLSTDFSEETSTVRFRDGELGVLNAFVRIVESKNRMYPEDFRVIYHFYDIVKEDPHRISLTQFDVGRWCFKKEQKKTLQFTVDLDMSDDNKHIVEKSTSDTTFLRLWRTAIADATGLIVTYMRISQMQATIIDDKLYVAFTLLDVHESLPAEAKKGQPSLAKVQDDLKKAIDTNGLSIDYIPEVNAKAITMKAASGSLVDAVDVIIDITTTTPDISLTTTTTPKPTLPHITILTELPYTDRTPGTRKPDTTGTTGASTETATGTSTETATGTSTKTPITDPKIIYDGYGPGTVAGLTIAMLLVGITAGAGGTFYRFNGLPCRR